MLTIGGGQRLFVLVGAGGRGAMGGIFFLVDRIIPSKKFKPPRSGKIIISVQ